MPRYDRGYDFGLRGRDDVVGRVRARRDSVHARYGGDWERRAGPRPSRVTARYNLDYVYGARGEENYPRNYETFGGDTPRRIGDEGYYRRPYTTIGGTRTFRGAPLPYDYDSDFDRPAGRFRRY